MLETDVHCFKDSCCGCPPIHTLAIALVPVQAVLCSTTSLRVAWEWEHYCFFSPIPWVFWCAAFCLSDVAAVQVGDTRGHHRGWAGRADQRHPAEGHQPLWRCRCQRRPLAWVSTTSARCWLWGWSPEHNALSRSAGAGGTPHRCFFGEGEDVGCGSWGFWGLFLWLY